MTTNSNPKSETMTVSDAARNDVNYHLTQIEANNDILVVYAVAHGSRAWGLHNDDSDYDVKGVYIPRDLASYARLTDHQEVLDRAFDDFEFELWDIKKFAALVRQSNDQAIDALRSPVVYKEIAPDIIDEFRELALDTYNPISLYHKYRSIAYNNYRKYLSEHLTSNRDNTYPIIDRRPQQFIVRNEYTGNTMTVPRAAVESNLNIELAYNQVDLGDKHDPGVCPECGATPGPYETTFTETQTRQTVKRNLAVMKAGLSAIYLRESGRNGEHQLPHIDFPTFLDEQAPEYIDPVIVNQAEALVERKQNGDNTVIGDKIPEHVAHPDKVIDPEIHNTGDPSTEELNELITRLIAFTQRTDR